MTFLDLFKSNPDIWGPISELLDTILTNGINDRFSRAEREYIFAYYSKINMCKFCYNHHIELAYELGYDDTIADLESMSDPEELENIFWIKNIATVINSAIKEYDITNVNNNSKKLKDTTVKNYGYRIG